MGDLDLAGLLDREPAPAERKAWDAMSPALRRRAAVRLDLMRRWTTDRGGLKADDAAVVAGVKSKRFYEMTAAWRREPGLAAVGAYATAPTERSARIDVRVNAALQAVVSKVVDAAPEGASIETLRRSLEAAVRLHLKRSASDAATLKMPSPNVVRAVVTREIHRRGELASIGESIAGDCCATTMLSPRGKPYVIFCFLDRGTRRILGHSLGAVAKSVAGYADAARNALSMLDEVTTAGLGWAGSTRQMNLVVGLDRDAWPPLQRRVADLLVRPQFEPIVNDRRFGSQFRRYVGDRIGRLVLRPTWTLTPPEDGGGQRFDLDAARIWAAAEVATYNAALPFAPSDGSDEPPEGLVATLRALSG